jgi:hypothetical protein
MQGKETSMAPSRAILLDRMGAMPSDYEAGSPHTSGDGLRKENGLFSPTRFGTMTQHVPRKGSTMANPAARSQVVEKKPPQLPPLETGDQLTREEFERRYELMPQVKKAELIEGEVYMPSPVRLKQHAGPHAQFITWLGVYQAYTPGVCVGAQCSIRMDLDNEPQPDGALMVEPAYGGQVEYEDDYVVGGPELVGEISASTASIDLTKKFKVYRRNQVREYIVWRVLDNSIDWFARRESQLQPLPLDAAGILRSEVFPGLWLDPAALVRGEMITVLAVLQQGLATAEHAVFVASLQTTFSARS